MTINNELATDTTDDTRPAGFRELKRKARAVKARPRKGRTGGRGSAVPAGPSTPIDSITSANLIEKESPSIAPVSHVSVATALTREDNWRSAGDIKATVGGRSINPRILEILLPSGERGRAIVQPAEHRKFGQKKPVWVKKDERGKHWLVVGRYSQWGVRVQ